MQSLQQLKPIASEPSLELKRFEYAWNTLCRKETPELLAVFTDVYYGVLDYYQMTLKATPLHVVNRRFGKRFTAVLNSMGLPPVPVLTLLHAACLTRTLPLNIQMNKRGGYVLLPKEVSGTWSALAMLEPTDPRWETLNDLTDVLEGEAQGPVLRGKGLERALAPFEPPATVQTPTESSTPAESEVNPQP